MVAKKFKFKKLKQETGLSAIGTPYPNTLILYDKMVVGYINAPNWRTEDNCWTVCLMCNTTDSWSWKNLTKKFTIEPEARNFLQQNIEKILALNLHFAPREDFE